MKALINFIPVDSIAWISLMFAFAWSVLFLMKGVGPTVMRHSQNHAPIVLAAIALVQLALALTLKFVFF